MRLVLTSSMVHSQTIATKQHQRRDQTFMYRSLKRQDLVTCLLLSPQAFGVVGSEVGLASFRLVGRATCEQIALFCSTQQSQNYKFKFAQKKFKSKQHLSSSSLTSQKKNVRKGIMCLDDTVIRDGQVDTRLANPRHTHSEFQLLQDTLMVLGR